MTGLGIFFAALYVIIFVASTKSAYYSGYEHGYVRGQHNMDDDSQNEGESE